MAGEVATPREYGLGKTERRDNWWVGPLATALGLGAFGLYSTFRVFYNAEYDFGWEAAAATGSAAQQGHSYLLSPFYSPLFLAPFREGWLPAWVSPAMLILWAPGGFRLTCYYYRKAYYRAFFANPPACGVGEPRKKYSGETRLFLFQNIHRYFLYLALAFLFILSYDVFLSMRWPTELDNAGHPEGFQFGVSVGTLVLLMNTTLLGIYTFSCHSLRHLVGGNVNCFSCVALGPARYKAWKGATFLNKNHMLYAWISLFMVGFADFYVWMVASGTITDLRII